MKRQRNQKSNCQHSLEPSAKQESSRKTSISASLAMPKLLTVWITTNCGKFLKRWEYQNTSPASREICMQVKKQQLELDMEQQTTQSCPTLCDPMDSSLPSSSVHGIFQAIVLEWIAISFSRVSSQPRDRTWVSRIVDRCFTI